MTINHIFIVGAGTMGNGIAQVAATSGYQVICMDVQPAALEKAKAAIAKSTAKLLEKGTITAEGKASADAITMSPLMRPHLRPISSSRPPPKTLS